MTKYLIQVDYAQVQESSIFRETSISEDQIIDDIVSSDPSKSNKVIFQSILRLDHAVGHTKNHFCLSVGPSCGIRQRKEYDGPTIDKNARRKISIGML